MEISTVNFDDLFDFSPEPLDQNSNDQTTHTITPPQTQQTSQTQQHSPISLTRQDLLQQEGHFKLSSSVPSNWGGSGYAQQHLQQQRRLQQQTETGASSSASSSFNTSVGQLLEDLPHTDGGGGGGSLSSSVKGKRGRKPGQRNLKTDLKSKLERSRQSARECRARKKLRYQYLDDLILEREKANIVLRDELLKFQKWCHELDRGTVPEGLKELLMELKRE